ncbi:MAG: protein translocase subunit SecF [Candidatus Tagabacteria bacterium CG_4_10_14_0_2_um_filter_40_13]|uniref:Protein-export membrane protein SecF n=3 Tax=Candidatus Tagaibacteriota TaxID=1817918 RepID=A0A2M8G8Z4_9BACT|nr:MAG: protein translocase subunit SecF [Candidatus Tagabacteria bacterium CG11_big_fil_rev_8_21_14_0_20_41_11]PIU99796.1 MAG: protein translocase subunit SecF [Candidatus Tagabacteria bacterium CG03_land_8_20_14_0_80_41_22]PIZ56010.1 MAG: protein translocase subunit SecF [Candidatus Tagabacteria bacterium CG_4_10_14_0_2_um_filter_40_13]PJC25262.1 MAG: protein translocase subunit SecF [Candidatus Tagabacteria bacterium CG_4_9_14_0_2_um_filter_41_11]PJC69892.1 MAG: protein translocase subunit S
MVRNRKITYIFSIALVVVSLSALFAWKLKLGIDFTGGSLLEAEYADGRPEISKIQQSVDGLGFGNIVLQPSGEKDLIVRLKDLSAEEHKALLDALKIEGKTPMEKRFDSIGPVIGKELKRKSLIAIGIVVLMIILYIAWAFRKVSRPVSSWKYGVVAVIALIHDITIPTGVFAFLGHFKGVEVDILFITALLTTLGFSVHDTIVVFDRIRENLRRDAGKSFPEVVEHSIRQTLARSIFTSMTVILVLIALLLFGGPSTKYFSLALLLGVTFGTYSSICLASPLLVTWQKWNEKTKQEKLKR